MKNVSVSVFLGLVLCSLVLWLSSCGPYGQLGETTAEGRRRHIRNARVNQQEMIEDIDKAMLADKPRNLTNKTVP